jgi:hypothetical protein
LNDQLLILLQGHCHSSVRLCGLRPTRLDLEGSVQNMEKQNDEIHA